MDAASLPQYDMNLAADPENPSPSKNKSKSKDKDKEMAASKRRCVSTACVACRRRKSKCDGNLPKCAACASVYLTECEYAPHTDHRRKGVYKKEADGLKSKNPTLQVLVHALLNAQEDEDAFEIVRQIRSSDNLEDLAQSIENRERGIMETPDSPIYRNDAVEIPQFEAELSGRMGDLVIDGSIKFVGGTSNLIWLNDPTGIVPPRSPVIDGRVAVRPREQAILGWTSVTQDKDLILHLMNMYFCWHYAYFTTLSKELFYKDFLTGTHSQYCSPLLVNVMLALGCHFSSKSAARANPEESSTTGDHYFQEAKRLLYEDDKFGIPKLCTVQALALMSVREAGCGRESKGWFYSGMSFRLASDLGLNVEAEAMNDVHRFSDEETDARRITFWGCFLFDKCWSNYLGRQPLFVLANSNVKKPDVFGSEDSELWSPYTDSGVDHAHAQPARTRAVSLQIFRLAEISSDLLNSFYQPQQTDKPISKQNELKKLSDLHTRLEAWHKELPSEMEAKEEQLPQVLLMHMFYQLLYIHLYRPFLKYTKSTSPLPTHVSPRKFCTQAASTISKLFRLYKRTHGLRQICNIAVYIAHSACTIHLLNLPDKNAKRDIIHGVKQLEEISDSWICARRTLRILGMCADKWKIELPEEAQAVLQRVGQSWAEWESSSVAPVSPILTATTYQRSPQKASGHTKQKLQYAQQYMPQHLLSENTNSKATPSAKAPRASMPTTTSTIENESLPCDDTSFVAESKSRTDAFPPKVSLRLTQAQQDAWNALQAKMGHLSPGIPRTQNELPLTAASMFGGIDSLMEESQDWWYQDQSQLAMGFDNWTTPTSSDWSQMTGHSGSGLSMQADTRHHVPPGQNSTSYMTAAQAQNHINHMLPPTASAIDPHPLVPNSHSLYGFDQSQPQSYNTSVSPPARTSPHNSPMGQHAQKRSYSFDDTIY